MMRYLAEIVLLIRGVRFLLLLTTWYFLTLFIEMRVGRAYEEISFAVMLFLVAKPLVDIRSVSERGG